MTTTITAINACDAAMQLDNATGTLTDISGSCISNSLSLTSDLGYFKVFQDRCTYRLVCAEAWEAKIEALYTLAANEALGLLRDWWFDSAQYKLARTITAQIGRDLYSGEVMLEELKIELPAGEAGPARATATLKGSGAITYTRIPLIELYAATRTMGVYYAYDVAEPPAMPSYTAINSGLASLSLHMMHVDLNNPSTYQYVISSTKMTLYKRANKGAWTAILTNAQAAALTVSSETGFGGYGLQWVTTKYGAPGELYVTYLTPLTDNGIWMLKSIDYGVSWSAKQIDAGLFNYGANTIDVLGDWIYMATQIGIGAPSCTSVSTDGGATFVTHNHGGVSNPGCVMVDPTSAVVSLRGLGNLNANLVRATDSGTTYNLVPQGLGLGIWLDAYPRLWISPTNSANQCLVKNDRFYRTADTWATMTTSAVTGKTVVMQVPDVPSGYTVACRQASAGMGDPHVVFITNDDGATMTNWAGPDPNGGVNSIPKLCGGITLNGFSIIRNM